MSDEPVKEGLHKLHLRGTVESADGDGAGEGGDLPPYESDVLYVIL